MKRSEFVKICALFGLSVPLHSSLISCVKNNDTPIDFTGKVIIIGAGAGGLSAAYLLQQQGIDFEILEASAVYGGRMRINTEFADFPIPLGAEWLETKTSIFKDIVNDSKVKVDVETFEDEPDRKFVNSSWYNFFETYIVPSISSKIKYNTVVKSIDYSGDKAIISTQDQQYTADKVIISVPLKILQDGDIQFIPSLPQNKQDAINNILIWEGFKAFFEFSTKFYPEDEYVFNVNPSGDGEKIYYDAALGQNSSKNIMGLFVVGKPALDYIALSSDALRDFVLKELDAIYANQATPNYIKHLSQNWNNEPFIKSGYMTDNADFKVVKKLGESVNNTLYFAGGPYTDGEDWVSVHAAAQSAKMAVNKMFS